MNDTLKLTEGFCRACLVKYDDPMDLLQYNERNRRLFIYSTGLQVKRNDFFIFQLCKDCFSSMKAASAFKKKCRTSDKKFKTFMGLRNAGDNIDFCNFLKNNDDSHAFRLPFVSGNSTPSLQRSKDDDNVSTCTSIRNFMTDLLKEDEIPDTEARIIKEVIEEEADISEDSLDSHWFQDEMSINGDITFDFSFSPFSTPRADRFQSPKPDLFANINTANFKTPTYLGKLQNLTDDISEAPTKIISIPDKHISIPEPKFVLNYYNSGNIPTKCSIDKRMNLALKNEENQFISLEELLGSPASTGLQGKQLPGAETPTINNILFGKALDTDLVGICDDTKTKEMYSDLGLAGHEDGENSLSSDFSYKEEIVSELSDAGDISDEVIDENTDIPTDKPKTENSVDQFDSPCDTENLHCKLCNKKYKYYFGLKMHFKKIHFLFDIPKQRKPEKRVLLICDYCGKSMTDRRYLINHIKSHNTSTFLSSCEICSLPFKSKHHLNRHMVSHQTLEERESKKKADSKFCCCYCGKKMSSSQNLKTHILRHRKTFKFTCEICDIGFFRRFDYIVHFRTHSGEKPYNCVKCYKSFARRDTLNKHHKMHLNDKRFECRFCGKSFITYSGLNFHITNSKKCIKKREE